MWRKLWFEGNMGALSRSVDQPVRSRSPADSTFCSAVSGEVVGLFVMGGNQSVPKITVRDRAILE